MQPSTTTPDPPEELEFRFQELRAQRERARQLFHCYAQDELNDEDPSEDVYYAYYGEEQ